MKRLLPAYPLFVKDPYFSIYSNGEELADSDTIFWTNAKRKLIGYIIVDGKRYSFLNSSYGALKQTSLEISTFKTCYSFQGDDFILRVEFVSPLPLDDLKLLSLPVCYMNYSFESSSNHEFSITLALSSSWCYDDLGVKDKSIYYETIEKEEYSLVLCGLKRQLYLSEYNDECLADWGYFYLSGEKVETRDDLEENELFISGTNYAKNGFLMLGHDDVMAIQYFNTVLTDYYFDDGKTIIDGLDEIYNHHEEIEEHLESFDKRVKEDALRIDEKMERIAYASYRQSIAAHKLVKNPVGELVFLSKECGSNGCIGTVDVSYPSIPLYLLYCPQLVKGMMIPIFDYARQKVWKYDFAPHDVGVYPCVTGQAYGVKENESEKRAKEHGTILGSRPVLANLPPSKEIFDDKMHMPVEESANLILMAAAYYKESKDREFLEKNYDLLSKWVHYIEEFGKVPSNQLCTDDFAGHLAKNINLSIKSGCALGAYSLISKELNQEEKAEYYRKKAEEFAEYLTEFSRTKEYVPLTYEEDEKRFSLKYNLAMDKLLNLNIYPSEIYEKEFEIYRKKINDFGIPLDERKEYTKVDWEMWIASFAPDDLKKDLLERTYRFLEESKDRLPFPDWFETKSSEYHYFKNRTVVGGNFFPILLNKRGNK